MQSSTSNGKIVRVVACLTGIWLDINHFKYRSGQTLPEFFFVFLSRQIQMLSMYRNAEFLSSTSVVFNLGYAKTS